MSCCPLFARKRPINSFHPKVSLELLFRQYSASQRITLRAIEEALDDISFWGESQVSSSSLVLSSPELSGAKVYEP